MANELTFEFDASALFERLDATRENVKAAGAAALFAEMEAVLTRSKNEFVPADDKGVLRDSGRVEAPEVAGDEISVTAGFGGPAAPYALAIHEHPSSHSPQSWLKSGGVKFHPAGHGAKYLEIPLLDAVAGLLDRIGARIRERLGGSR